VPLMPRKRVACVPRCNLERGRRVVGASAAGTPPDQSPAEDEIMDPGYHVRAGGALELVVGICAAALALLRWRHLRRPK